ncbi:hypothetical protein VSDG_07897 [Cytospora chrysosperma]|uniref:Uncharacterized protein n=1 Tax=Cytospora chrysosperma TaxID=252740 RepID=A0A423VKT5_CYTCH|nr:hypothetical protein VSDG_07897 [Valsa sordida]
MSSTTVIVTGAGGGLGKAIATAFLATGANVAICDVNQERITATEQEWTSAGHKADKFLTAMTDVADRASVQKLVDDTVARFGRLDVLVNNAGIMDNFSAVGDCAPEIWNRVLDVNLHGPFNACAAAVKQFQEQDQPGGLIFNICSIAARFGHFSGVAYTVSKHGLTALNKNTAFAYGDKGIYSIALRLGTMKTNITDAMAKGVNMDLLQKFMASHTKVDIEKHGVALEDVANYIVFVSSNKGLAKSLNGSAVDLTNNWPEA